MARLTPIEGSTPSHWFVCFSRESELWWARWLAFGRYCHVSAFGHLAPSGDWLFVDLTRAGLSVRVMSSGAAGAAIGAMTENSDVIHIAARPASGLPVLPVYCCTVAIRHLIGAQGGALRPDRLWRDLLAQGAEIFYARHDSPSKPDERRGSDGLLDPAANGT